MTISPTPFLVHPSSTPLPTATPAPSLPPTNTPTATSTPSPTPGYAPVIRFPTWALIHDLAWSPDGEHIAISAGTDVFLYDRAARLEQTFPVGVWAERVAFHPSQPVLAAAVKDGSIRFWDTVTGAETCRFPAHLKGANSLAFQPGGELLASTGNDIISHLWDIASVLDGGCDIHEVAALIGASYTASDILFSPDGGQFALVDVRNIRLRDSATRKLIVTLRGDRPIFDLAISPDGRWLAAAQDSATLALWDLAAQPKPTSTTIYAEAASAKAYLWRAAFSPDNRQLAAGASDGTLIVWALDTLQPVFIRHLSSAIPALDFNPKDGLLAVGGLDGSVYFWDILP